MSEQRLRDCFRSRAGGDVIRYRITTDRAELVAFTVQFEVWIDDEQHWRPAVRYDTAHGHAHRDILNWDGTVRDKWWFPDGTTFKVALTAAEHDLVTHGQTCRDDFLRRWP